LALDCAAKEENNTMTETTTTEIMTAEAALQELQKRFSMEAIQRVFSYYGNGILHPIKTMV